jgi:glycerol-3-phosphate dehydrogenase
MGSEKMENRRNGDPRHPPGVFDVLVIGAGIVGSMVARELSRYERRIALIDKEPSPGCGVSKAGASLIHSPLMCPPGTLKGRLCQGAPLRYKKLAGELDVGFREMDELFVALDPSQMANLENLRKRGESYGMTSMEMIGAEKIRELEPSISPKAVAALSIRGLLAVYPPEWAFALTENARDNGVELHLGTTVTGITKHGDLNYAVHTDRGTFSTRRIINSAGLFADEIAAMVGDDGIHLILTKATMAILEKSAPPLIHHAVYGTLSNTHSQLLTPTAHGNLLIGLGHFTTPGHKQDTFVTREKVEEILTMGQGLVPTLSGSRVISTFAGIRSENSRASQGDFYIDHSAKAPGVIHAFVGSPGLTAAPAIAELVVKMIGETGMPLTDKNSFQKERQGWFRFSDGPIEKRREVSSSNPRYGQIVCRCEQVTEGEILEAMRRGADTLDGIKHATRAAMGCCQGGFCGVQVLNLLAAHLNGRPDRVTKKGRESFQILGSV